MRISNSKFKIYFNLHELILKFNRSVPHNCSNIQKEERNRDRLLKDQEKNKEQLISITDSFARAQQINESVVNDLYKETKRYEQREENMKVIVLKLNS